ncbi:immunoglobulin I-set domain protein [Necator americanus]|uniref:Immunoglobulin I-set domain protein n=1 Tax=Necator americanus TaxID=51031 RepID=W2TSH3_NECAM|nr:immunoglobulin I-set domain protein [Necator americanus]ETN84066.1 immunoglobulin I-set domain protein [Necator americanus]
MLLSHFEEAPIFDFVPTNKTVIEGSNVFWRCHADTQPNGIQYTWIFRDRPIKTTETGLRVEIKEGDLSLRAVRKSDRGWYVCKAHSPSGEQSKVSAFLDVLCFSVQTSELFKFISIVLVSIASEQVLERTVLNFMICRDKVTTSYEQFGISVAIIVA